MLSYQALDCYWSQNKSNTRSINYDKDISHQKMERMKHIFKCYRAAIDFDKSFVIEVVSATDFDWDKEIVLGEKKKNRGRKRKIV